MQRLDEARNMGTIANRPSRSASYSSDLPSSPSLTTPILATPTPPVRPPPAYIAQSAASHLVADAQALALPNPEKTSTEHPSSPLQHPRENALFSDGALAQLNSFLDHLLYKILGGSSNPGLHSLRAAVEQVVRGRLGRLAIQAAEDELEELVAEGDEEEIAQEEASRAGQSMYDVDLFFRRTRLRIMVYMRLGEMEDEDEEEHLEEFEDRNSETDEDTRNDGLVSWAGAIFLTSVLEYVAEECIKVAGRAAYKRTMARRTFQSTSAPSAYSSDQRIVVVENDVDKAGIDSRLGRLWRSWKHKMRAPYMDHNRSISGPRSGPNSRKASISTMNSDATKLPPPEPPLPFAAEEATQLNSEADRNGATNPVGREGEAADQSRTDVPKPLLRRPTSLLIPSSSSMVDHEVASVPAESTQLRRRARASTLPNTQSWLSTQDTPIYSPEWFDANDEPTATPQNQAKETTDGVLASVQGPAPNTQERQILPALETSEPGKPEDPSAVVGETTNALVRPTTASRLSTQSMKAGIRNFAEDDLSQPQELARAAEATHASPLNSPNSPTDHPSVLPLRDQSDTSRASSSKTSFEDITRPSSMAVPFGSTRVEPISPGQIYPGPAPRSNNAQVVPQAERVSIPQKPLINGSPINPLASHPIPSLLAVSKEPLKQSEQNISGHRTPTSAESSSSRQVATNGPRESRSGSGSYKSAYSTQAAAETLGNRFPTTPVAHTAEKDFGDLLAAKETMKYTLTPRQLQDIEQPDWTRYSDDATPTNETSGFSVTRMPTSTRTGATSTIDEHPMPVSPISPRPSLPTERPAPTALKPSKAGYVPREARVQTDHTLDFADYIRSTGPDSDRRVTPFAVSPLSGVNGSPVRTATRVSRDATPVIPSASRYARASQANGSVSSRSTTGSKTHLQPRDATVQRGVSADLIELLRDGPPGGPSGRMGGSIARSGLTTSDRLSGQSPANRSSSFTNQSAGTSVGSQSGLLAASPTSRPSQARQSEPTSAPSANGRSLGKAPPPVFGKTIYRNKDPYALPSDDEEDMDEAAAYTPQRKPGESLADFLMNNDPPGGAKRGGATGGTSRAPAAKFGTYDQTPNYTQQDTASAPPGMEMGSRDSGGNSRPFWRKKAAT